MPYRHVHSLLALLCLNLLVAGQVEAFAEDSCPIQGQAWMQCSLSPCTADGESSPCETISMLTTVTTQQMSGRNGGSRSNVHFDSTYYLAQALGLGPRDAYQAAAYDQAVDTGSYAHRDQSGQLVADPSSCGGTEPPPACQLNTLHIDGVGRNNFTSGGLFFHFMAPLAGAAANGLSPQVDDPAQEPQLHNIRRWLYGLGPLCVAGLTQAASATDLSSGTRCYQSQVRGKSQLMGRIPFITETGYLGYADWLADLGEQTIVTDPISGELTPASALENYLSPGPAEMARLGLYLHAVQDRVSHHRCNLASAIEGPRAADAEPIPSNPLIGPGYDFLQTQDPNDLAQIFTGAQLLVDAEFFYQFDETQCDQPSHANRHVWEVGRSQADLAPEDRTTEAALKDSVAALQAFMDYYRLPKRSLPADWLAQLVAVLEVASPNERLAAFCPLVEQWGLLPAPGHCGENFEQWNAKAGDYSLQGGSSDGSGNGNGGIAASLDGAGRSGAGLFPSLVLVVAALLRRRRRPFLALILGGSDSQQPPAANRVPPVGAGGGGGGAVYCRAPWRLRTRRVAMALALGLILPTGVDAYDFEWNGISGQAQLSLSSGIAVRTQGRSNRFIGKTNVEGQQNLCVPDDCLSFTGDPAPNQRLLDAEGGFFIINGDNGNLNYDKGDIVYASNKMVPKLSLSYQDWTFRFSAIGLYDPVNESFNEQHPNTLYQPRKTKRPSRYTDDFALSLKPRELFLTGPLRFGDHEVTVSVGNQNIRWGEANLLLFSTLNQINPPDATVARLPGFQFSELPIPVPSLIVGGDIGGGLSLDAVYMLGWKPVVPDPPGTFMSTSDVAGGGEYAQFSLGQFAEDPDGQHTLVFPASLASQTTSTVKVLDEDYGYPHSHDEYGLKLSYYADWLNGGTEFGLYYLHYNSRLPYFAGYASQDSCARDSPDVVQALAVCRGFAGSLDPLVPGVGLEPLPLDTAQFFLDYPKGLQMFGVSFNSNVGSWALSGELAYHRQLPIQVSIVDVAFAALQPGFPRQDLYLGVDTLSQLVNEVPLVGDTLAQVTDLIGNITAGTVPEITIPAASHAVPSYIVAYRGQDIKAGQYIRGYEKRDVAQLVLDGIRIVRENPIGADQIIFLAEAGLTYIVNMPGRSQFQFEGGGDNTHAGPGADGTGAPDGKPDPSRVNPTQQTDGYASQTSYGYRLLIRPSYSQVWGGINVLPALLFQHDLQGTSPFPMQNFIEGRKNAWLMVDFELNRNAKLSVGYNVYFGANKHNLLEDRDNATLALTWDF